MVKARVRHLLVTDAAGALAGIVTDRDIRLDLPSQATSLSVWEINLPAHQAHRREVMTSSVITVGPDGPAQEAARLMLDHKIGALPVLDDGRLGAVCAAAGSATSTCAAPGGKR
jgi:acetoin utilization protein AcuB